jgi:hypothetical protein
MGVCSAQLAKGEFTLWNRNGFGCFHALGFFEFG